MRNYHARLVAVMITALLGTAACTSGGGSMGVTPIPGATSATTVAVGGGGAAPATPPPPAQGLVAPTLTANPAGPAATGNATFANTPPGTAFPLVLTAAGLAFSGDSSTTASGGTLQQESGGLTLTLNNSALHVTGARPNAFPYNSGIYNPGALGSTPVLALLGASDNLDYTRFGYWTLPDTNPYYDVGGGAWLAGYVTPASQLPTSGSANYSGRAVGLASSYPTCQCSDFMDFAGVVAMTANFGTRAIFGSITNLKFTNMEFADIPLNDVGFAATLDPTRGTYTGTTSALTFPVNPYPNFPFAVGAGASGAITGAFYGPSAQETGAVWTLSDGTHRLIGSFGAAKGP
jgi:C-lobe and N-lobe beta barrels of Tf-binding protein B